MPGIKPKSLFELKKLPKQRRSKATVEAILEAATQLLLEIGYDKTSTNRIAGRAGASIGHAINKAFVPLQSEFSKKLEIWQAVI